jgi:hypothetical protein
LQVALNALVLRQLKEKHEYVCFVLTLFERLVDWNT